MPKDGFVTANGLRIHYQDFRGEGRPVVAIHGMASTGWVWRDLPRALGRRVVAVDVRGHGDSQWSADGGYFSADAAADVAGVMDALGLGEVDVIGHSWGGLIAIALADRLGATRVRRLVVVDIPPSSTQKPDEVAPRQVVFDTWAAAFESERKRSPRGSDEALANLTDRTYRPAEGGRFVKKMDPALLRRWDFRSEDHWPALGRLAQPTLVIKGGNSATVPDEVAEKMAATLRDGRWVTVPDTGHAVHIENPAGFHAVVKPFLDE